MATNSTAEIAQALWYIAPGQAEIREEILAAPRPGEVRVRALFGALSRGTEALVLAGRVPESEFERMRAPFMGGRFSVSGKIWLRDGWPDRRWARKNSAAALCSRFTRIKAFSIFLRAPSWRCPRPCRRSVRYWPPIWKPLSMPSGMRRLARRTALQLLARARSARWSRFCAARLAGAEVTLVDINERRAELAQKLGVRFAKPETAKGDCDLVVHASGTAAGLRTALALAGEEATVLELSWYGDTPVTAPLGGAFHSRRLRLISSQVGKVAASHRPRWTHDRRLAAAVDLLADPRLDALLAPTVAFCDLPRRLPDILDARNGVVCQLISYS